MAWLSRICCTGFLLLAALGAGTLAATAQDATNASKQNRPVPWSSNCASGGRGLPLECVIEQRALLRQTGRLIGKVTIRIPAETKKPVIMIQVPLGLFLPAGLTVDVDGDMAQTYPVQTCNGNGCFVGFPISEKLLTRMFNGGKLNLTFQYLDKKPFTLPMSLAGFTEVYSRIK